MVRRMIGLILTVCLLVHMGCATTGPASRSSSQDKRPVVNVGDRVEITLKDGEVVKGYVQRVGRSSLTLWRRDQRTGWKREIAWKEIGKLTLPGERVVEPAPASGSIPIPIVSEFLLGSLGAFAGMVSGLEALPDISYPFGRCDDCISTGGILGIIGGSTLGGSAGVYLMGRIVDGSGQALPTLVGGVLGAFSAFGVSFLMGGSWGSLILSSIFLPAAGATIGFNWPSVAIPLEKGNTSFALPRRPMHPLESRALLHMEDDKLRLGIPSSTLRPLQLPRNELGWEYQIRLVSVRF